MAGKNDNRGHESHHHSEEAVKLLLRGLIPIVFLAGGVIILALRISGWSLFLGIPLTIFGVAFLIYTYDEVVSRKFEEEIPTKLKKKNGTTFVVRKKRKNIN